MQTNRINTQIEQKRINFIQLFKVDTKLSQEQVSQELLGHKEYSSYVITFNVKPILYLYDIQLQILLPKQLLTYNKSSIKLLYS